MSYVEYMDSSLRSVSEVTEIAASILREELGEPIADAARLQLLKADSEPGAEVWTLEAIHPSGTEVDVAAGMRARRRIAIAVARTGDPRLVILSHRFAAPDSQAA